MEGLSTFIHLDYWREQFPVTTKVRGIADAGFFLDTNSVYGLYFFIILYLLILKNKLYDQVIPLIHLECKEDGMFGILQMALILIA